MKEKINEQNKKSSLAQTPQKSNKKPGKTQSI
jgi:hypothetical protein